MIINISDTPPFNHPVEGMTRGKLFTMQEGGVTIQGVLTPYEAAAFASNLIPAHLRGPIDEWVKENTPSPDDVGVGPDGQTASGLAVPPGIVVPGPNGGAA